MKLVIGSLNKSTNYTIKLFARNYVFEGKATERKIQTKYEGMKICTKNNTLRDLHNSSYDTKAEFNNCFIIHLK